ncbi:MAG: glutamine amidotransferase, partial [Luteolibacter sp.]
STELTIGYAGQTLHQQTVSLNGGWQQITADFISPHLGCHFYDITLSPLNGEAHTGNNHMRAACELRRDLIRVLYMEGSEPKETAYLKDALEADPEMSVTCLHFPGQESLEALASQALAVRGKDKRVFQDNFAREIPSVCHATRGYPATLEELLKYDVVIDSDIIKEAFSPQQMANTVEFVERFGGGFVMVGGFTSFGAGGYETTVFNKLMPVEIANKSDPMSLTFRPKLTPAGLVHPIMQVGANEEENRQLWNTRIPYFRGINYARRAKPGAHVLAEVNSPQLGADQNLVLFAVQDIGRGRTMAFMSDTTEGWGAEFERSWGEPGDKQKYFRKFWNNTIRWLAEERIANKIGRVGIIAPATRVLPGDVVPLSVQALPAGDHSGLEVTLKQEGNNPITVPMQWNGARHVWEGSFVPRIDGDVIIEAAYRSAEGKPVVTRSGIHVDQTGDETIAVATRSDLMEELARETGGSIVNQDNIRQTLEALASRSSAVVWKRALPIWDKWWVMLPILLLAVAEWCLRRMIGRGPGRPASPEV